MTSHQRNYLLSAIVFIQLDSESLIHSIQIYFQQLA